ncbi:MAG: hypothetical protein CVT63_03685 [Candidatus Anoxymicrobium japonicum]|uniref:Pterin-binding domain-containing protein n=1 Tax=Candidatus Anoxymicrobium japonicum TaxID=2013648 RepID=A0A2N3G6D9_9ACTN|nr:MAG: hypothetical protein CVT63_03685 [Candidatus Anoxymicrobium japonicum]
MSIAEKFGHTVIVGERINPTGRTALSSALSSGELEVIEKEAVEQAAAGCDFIDVNVGCAGVDEVDLLPRAARMAVEASDLPVCVDSSDPAALRAALDGAPEGWLVNSVIADRASIEAVAPAAAKAGAYLVGMAKDSSMIPETCVERMRLARVIVETCEEYGLHRDRLLIDFLTLPAGLGSPAKVTLECIERCHEELGCGTLLGASNVSYGMPSRSALNSAFISMSIDAGLDAALVNPLDEAVMLAIFSSDVMCGRDPRAARFMKRYRRRKRDN